ncbi:MAG TPA: hypothetical protein VGG94_07890 [Chthoniobacterales bacterium]
MKHEVFISYFTAWRRVARAIAFFAFPCSLLAANEDAFRLAGQTVKPGGTLEIQFPVAADFQDYAAAGGNPRPERGRALLMFPARFDPKQRWPLLIITSTTDANRTSPMDAWWYRHPAMAEGWVVLATDAAIRPRQDSTMWRMGMLAAGLQEIRREWPQSAQWPVAFAGLSGGAKRSGVLAAMLAKSGTVNICGMFLSGINDDRVSPAYRDYGPPPNFLNVPIWLSSGSGDGIAPPAAHDRVKLSLERAGFTRVRVEGFDGGHELKPAEVQRALRWFRQLGKF